MKAKELLELHTAVVESAPLSLACILDGKKLWKGSEISIPNRYFDYSPIVLV